MTFSCKEEQDRFIERNMGLVRTIVLKLNKGVFDDDLLQQGYLGLMNAANGFDPNKGCKFSSFAWIYIKGYIMNYKKLENLINPLQCKNNWVDYAKINSVNEMVKDSSQEIMLDVADTYNIDEVILFMDLVRFKNSLELSYQNVLNMRLDDNTYEQIAKKLGVTCQAVSKYMKILRKKYLEYNTR